MTHSPPRAFGRLAAGTGALLLSTAGIAACGSSQTASVAAVGGRTVASAVASPAPTGAGSSAQLVRYSQCMRGHGVPDFPDPTDGHLILHAAAGRSGGLDPGSPAFQSASLACKSLQPAGPAPGSAQSTQMQAQALRFSACMRAHGVADFPDPTFSGGHVMLHFTGVDPSSPAFQSAQRACASLVPGGAP